jgi:hypothetical protein
MKTETMAFRGRNPIRCKIIISNKIKEQINIYNYLGHPLSYEGEKYVTGILTKFLHVTRIINQF